MLLQEHDITFVYIRGKDNILADAISRLPTLDIYDNAIETQHSPTVKTTTTQQEGTIDLIQYINSAPLPQCFNMNSSTIQTLQKQDKFSKNIACELHLGTNSSFHLNTKGVLKCTMVINNLEVSTIVLLLILTNTLSHKFHNCREHQGCARALNTLKRKFWWKGMQKHIKYYISNCITCSKNLPNILCHLQLHLEIPEFPCACIAIDTIGKLPTTSSGNALVCSNLYRFVNFLCHSCTDARQDSQLSHRSIFIRNTIQSLCFHGMSFGKWLRTKTAK